MTFEEWRRNEGLSYDALARRFGLSSATHARRYALGVVEVPADLKEQIIEATAGAVSLADFHGQRLALTRHRRRRVPLAVAEASPQ
ncbi:MAG: hypothetical protein DI549_20600 [Ancylobacter novellus]|uniref:XRE family transcriptional regulator n=1 Tax=Ancylobacter novellus TaxID=921 RepID=A0A2W5S8Z5_ANCNO|nr:MAG: hypothetical protein DI549_20600 [Ancylobacter novellus]